MSISDWYVSGGVEYMHPITLAFVANVVVILITTSQLLRKKEVQQKLIEAGKQLGALALALGAFGTIAGLFQAFDSLEASKEVIPFQVIMGGLKVAIINLMYGLIVFCISLVAYIILKLTTSKTIS